MIKQQQETPAKPEPTPAAVEAARERAGIIRRHMASSKDVYHPRRPILNDRRVATDLLRAASCAHQEARQIRRAFREFEIEGAEELIQARHAGRVRGEVTGYLDLGRSRYGALRRGVEIGAVSVAVIGYEVPTE